jgi:chemotaxis protein methyltransferase CheR
MAFTFFFRDLHVLELAADHAVPALSGRSHGKVWDAGCAMGPEPYSLAMIFAERMGPFAFHNFRLNASDLDGSGQFGPTIVSGVYPDADLERIPEPYRSKYFEKTDRAGCSRVVDGIRSRVHFEQHDLLSLKPVGEGFTLIVCKNVLLHFPAASRVQVIRMFHGALAPGGYLAMEQTQPMPEGLSGLFERVVCNAQLFRKVAGPCA